VLRMEDLDTPRNKPGVAHAILEDLRWLGITWDEGPDHGGPYLPYTQSERLPRYRAALQQLEERDLIYPCYCSRRDIQGAASAPHGAAAEGPRYPGTCRDPADRARQARRFPERSPAYRFKAPDTAISLHDRFAGRYSRNLARDVGDFVLWRADGIPAYQLAVAVDDGAMQISEVIRGADLLSSTPRQIALLTALGYRLPAYGHVPLLYDAQGRRLAKRDSLEQGVVWRDATPEQVVGALAAGLGLIESEYALSATELLYAVTPALLQRRLQQLMRHQASIEEVWQAGEPQPGR
jgi:glutamyl-tRNA synthetase